MRRFICLALYIFCCVSVNATLTVVSPSQKGAGLKHAVTRSSAYDTVLVKAGTYHISGIVIDHPLTIIGENNPQLDASSGGEVISVKSDHVTICAITVMNTGRSDLNDYAGIKIYGSKHCSILKCTIRNTYFGIYLTGADSCSVINNTILGSATAETSAGNGIHLWKSEHIRISGNTIDQHRDGIYFEFVTSSIIENNYSSNNLRYGLHFMFSDSDQYVRNTFIHNGAGVAVMYSHNILMTENLFSNNWGPTAYGLLLKDISRSVIRNNNFGKNTVGVHAEGSSHLLIDGNTFENNGWALKIMANCTEDTLTQNNFTGNSFDISTNGNTNENVYSRNYWDNYNGYDLNGDNIGDVPYRPVSLFSLVVEEIPCAIILLRSFMVGILNQAEKTVPVFIPDTIIDNEPAMTMYDAGSEEHS